MNSTPVFNFIDFYKFNINLIFYKTTSVYNFNIVIDNVSGQTSTIKCLQKKKIKKRKKK
jgi:hypothetical protein